QSHWIPWSLRKTSHFLRRYQASPDLIVLGFQLWPPLPDKCQSRSLSGRLEKPSEQFLLFAQMQLRWTSVSKMRRAVLLTLLLYSSLQAQENCKS
ncbi:hypothetical protein U0070_008053, partial [Myodes glareolus]